MRMRTLLTAALAVVMVVMTASIANAQEVGCYTAEFVWDDDGINGTMIVLEKDEGVEHSYVGKYAWIRYDELEDNEKEDSTYDNVVSYHIPWGSTDKATICTTYWEGTGVITAEDVAKVTEVRTPTVERAAVVITSLNGYEAWVLSTGAVAL